MWGCSLRPLEHFWISGRILHSLFPFPTWATTPKSHQCDPTPTPLRGPPGTLRDVRSAFSMDNIDGLTNRSRAPQRPVKGFWGVFGLQGQEEGVGGVKRTPWQAPSERYIKPRTTARRSSLAHLFEDVGRKLSAGLRPSHPLRSLCAGRSRGAGDRRRPPRSGPHQTARSTRRRKPVKPRLTHTAALRTVIQTVRPTRVLVITPSRLPGCRSAPKPRRASTTHTAPCITTAQAARQSPQRVNSKAEGSSRHT